MDHITGGTIILVWWKHMTKKMEGKKRKKGHHNLNPTLSSNAEKSVHKTLPTKLSKLGEDDYFK